MTPSDDCNPNPPKLRSARRHHRRVDSEVYEHRERQFWEWCVIAGLQHREKRTMEAILDDADCATRFWRELWSKPEPPSDPAEQREQDYA